MSTSDKRQAAVIAAFLLVLSMFLAITLVPLMGETGEDIAYRLSSWSKWERDLNYGSPQFRTKETAHLSYLGFVPFISCTVYDSGQPVIPFLVSHMVLATQEHQEHNIAKPRAEKACEDRDRALGDRYKVYYAEEKIYCDQLRAALDRAAKKGAELGIFGPEKKRCNE